MPKKPDRVALIDAISPVTHFAAATLIASTIPLFVLTPVSLPGQETQRSEQSGNELEQLRQATIRKGLRYLAEHGQDDSGAFTPRAGGGITALAVTSALRNGRGVDDPMVAKGLAALEKYVQDDGGIYGGGRLKNYETCVAMVAFAEANSSGKYNEILRNARAFIEGLQTSGNPRRADDPWYGGIGYSGSGRPDMSNTSYFIEALNAVGAEEDAISIGRAMKFISRCQNLPGHGNDTRFAALVGDGGFYYSIPSEDEAENPAANTERFTANGGLRSYGSMTYSGLKSMIYAGLTSDDPRVKSAIRWIRQHYSLDKNPGMGTAGLFYYYHTFGSAFKAAGLNEIVDAEGNKHDWREDLIRALAKRQNSDGSWTNSNERWLENDPNLATSFALIALSYCEPIINE